MTGTSKADPFTKPTQYDTYIHRYVSNDAWFWFLTSANWSKWNASMHSLYICNNSCPSCHKHLNPIIKLIFYCNNKKTNFKKNTKKNSYPFQLLYVFTRFSDNRTYSSMHIQQIYCSITLFIKKVQQCHDFKLRLERNRNGRKSLSAPCH